MFRVFFSNIFVLYSRSCRTSSVLGDCSTFRCNTKRHPLESFQHNKPFRNKIPTLATHLHPSPSSKSRSNSPTTTSIITSPTPLTSRHLTTLTSRPLAIMNNHSKTLHRPLSPALGEVKGHRRVHSGSVCLLSVVSRCRKCGRIFLNNIRLPILREQVTKVGFHYNARIDIAIINF